MCTICDCYDKKQISLEAAIFAFILLYKYLGSEHRQELYWKLYFEAEENQDWYMIQKLVFYIRIGENE